MTPLSIADRYRLRACFVFGIAASGFFDGILLHQVLQWHHLLSAVELEAVRDLRVQLAADGLFHVLMYVIALLGVGWLWRARGTSSALSGGRAMAAGLLGFGVWNFIDVVGFHWLLGIHHIRMDTPHPIRWDVGWVTVFGAIPLAIGTWLRGRTTSSLGGGGGNGRTAVRTIGAATLAAGLVAGLPPRDVETIVVVVRPGADRNLLLDAVSQMRGGVLWANPAGTLWAFRVSPGSAVGDLYHSGALWVTSSPALLGCLGWSKTT